MGFDGPAGAGPNDLLVAVRADGRRGAGAGRCRRWTRRSPALGRPGVRRAAAPAPRRAAHDRVRPPRVPARDAGIRLRARAARVRRGHGRAGRRAARHGLQRQRAGRAGGAAQGGARAAGPARDGTRLRHGGGRAASGSGFANVVRPGPVGIVAASGTGRAAADVPARRRRASASATASASAAATCPPRSAAGPTRQALATARRRPGHRAHRAWCPSRRRRRSREAGAALRRAGSATPVQFALLGAGEPDLTATAADAVARRRAAPGPSLAAAGTVPPSLAPGTAAGCLRGPVLRRHAVRRGDGHRGRGRSARSRSNIPLLPELGACPTTCAADRAHRWSTSATTA